MKRGRPEGTIGTITLRPNDGVHRHKSRCIHYLSSENYCTHCTSACGGSAHCEFYREKTASKPTLSKAPTQSKASKAPKASKALNVTATPKVPKAAKSTLSAFMPNPGDQVMHCPIDTKPSYGYGTVTAIDLKTRIFKVVFASCEKGFGFDALRNGKICVCKG